MAQGKYLILPFLAGAELDGAAVDGVVTKEAVTTTLRTRGAEAILLGSEAVH